MDENWISVPGYEGIYEVSDIGRVRRNSTTIRCGTQGKGRRILPARIIPPTAVDGYQRVNLWNENKYKQYQVHRLVLEAFRGESALSVDHLNGSRSDNRLVNLEYCSLEENTKRQHAAGRVVFVNGEENGKSKLKTSDIPVIRDRIARGERQADIASDFNVSRGTIQAIRHGRTWSHVK